MRIGDDLKMSQRWQFLWERIIKSSYWINFLSVHSILDVVVLSLLTKKFQKVFIQVLGRYYKVPEVCEEAKGFSGQRRIILTEKTTAKDAES